jgi:hypothetical protein
MQHLFSKKPQSAENVASAQQMTSHMRSKTSITNRFIY